MTRYGCRAVMTGLREGRVWVDHGHLLDGLEVRLRREHGNGRGVTLGGRLRVRSAEKLTLSITVTSASRPNPHGNLPRPPQVDVIRGRCAARSPTVTRGRPPTRGSSTRRT